MFQGSGVALITPFKNNQIDEAALIAHIEAQIAAGTQVLVPMGTTGESATLSHKEHKRVVEVTVKTAAGRVKVLAGAGSNSTEEAILLTRYAKEVGADGALHINPYYNKPSQAGLIAHFESIASSTDLPMVLYNIPGRTGINMLPSTMAQLARHPNIIGVKEATGNLVQVSEILERCGPDFLVLSGEDALTFPMLCLGAHGAISVTANLKPASCRAMSDALKAGDLAQARKIHFELSALNEVLFIETNPAPIKAALAMMGKISEEIRSPLVGLEKANQDQLKAVLQQEGLI